MLDDVAAAHPFTTFLRALRRALALARVPGPEEAGEVTILAAPYRTLLDRVSDRAKIKARIEATQLPPAVIVAKMVTGMYEEDPARSEELIGLLVDLGWGDLFEPLLAAAKARDKDAMIAAVIALGLPSGSTPVAFNLRELVPDAQPEEDLGLEGDEEEIEVDDHGLSVDDQRRWAAAMTEVLGNLGVQLEPGQAAEAVDQFLTRVDALEADDGVDDYQRLDADHVPGADQVQITIPVDKLGEIVVREVHAALYDSEALLHATPHPTEGEPPDEATVKDAHDRAVARWAGRAVEAALMDGRRRLTPRDRPFAEEATKLSDTLFARFSTTGALEVSVDGERALGVEPRELERLVEFIFHTKPEILGRVRLVPDEPADDVRVV